MADEDITLDGKPLHSLRVADLKDALQQRKLPKSGQKNALIKRLKGALMLENLQKSSASHSGLQPNSQIGEEMSQNSFIKQYLATQQELLLQKLEREAAQATETDESSATEEKEEPCDRTEDSSFVADMCLSGAPQPLIGRPAPEGLRGQQAAPEGPGAWPLWSSRPQREASPPRAVASLSVRVLGQPDLQGLPPAAPQRAPDKEGVAPVEPGSAHPAHHLSRSAAAAAPSRDDSEDEDSEEESEEEEEWGGVPARSGRAPAQLRPPQQQQPAPPAAPPRSRRKLQPPQHIPPPQQAHPPPMQLRHPTPPPSPPPELSFPLPDTPKQSPPNAEEEAGGSGGESPGAPGGRRPAPQRQDSDDSDDSDSSAGSSSPEHAQRRGAGPLARLVLKMDTEKGAEPEAVDMSVGGARRSSAASSSTAAPTQQPLIPGRAEKKEMRPQEDEKKKRPQEEEKMRPQEEEKRTPQEKKEATGVESTAQMGPGDESDGRAAAESDRRLPPWKRGRTAAQLSRPPGRGGGEAGPNTDPPARRDAAPLRASAGTPSLALKRPQMVPQLSPAPPRGAVVVTLRDSGSSCDSDSGADSSRSSSSSKEKPRSARIVKSAGHGRKADEERKTDPERVEAPTHQAVEREVSETSKAPAKEAEPHTPSAAANEPAPEAKPANGSGLEESNTPKVFTARKISLSSSKTSPPAGVDGAMGAAAESEAGAAAAGRKRRWGSSAGVTAKKPSISITTDSLKSLIPDIKVSQEAVVDLHPAELQLSGGEEEEEEEEEEREGRRGVDNGRADRDLGLKIRRTVTQVVPGNGQENGQGEEQHPMEEGEGEEEEAAAQEEDKQWRLEKEQQHKAPKERRRSSTRGGDDNGGVAGATHRSPAQQEAEAQKVTPSDSVVRRSISQQKSGMSVTIDDAAGPAAPRQPSPPRGKLSAIVHVTNLVRPFTLGQLKELLKRTGSLLEEGFWIDKIKSHCFVTYATTDEAQATRTALHGLKWPPSNPKVLSVDYSQQDELDFHRGTLKVERPPERSAPPPAPRLPPLMPERDRGGMERDKGRERGGVPMREQWAERGQVGVVLRDPWGAGRGGPPGGGGGGVRDQWAEREREMQRREQARCEREWDRDKIREFGQPGEEPRRSRSRDRERRRRDQAKSKERKADKKDEPPAKLLDDLFLKTTAAPCIYWLPLTEEQVKKRREQDQEESRKKEEERKERLKAREAGGLAAGGGGGGGAVGGGGAGGRGGGGRAVSGARRPDAPQERDGDRKRDGFRSRGPSGGGGLLGGGGDGGGGGGRHSRSRSNPRVRRR